MATVPEYAKAKEGHAFVEMACRCKGTVIVRAEEVGGWRCQRCKETGHAVSRGKLGPGGTLPRERHPV